MSVHGPLWLHFEPLQLLNVDFNADPDQPFEFDADPDLTFEYLLVENSVPEDVQRDPGHIQRENHQRELLPHNPDFRLHRTN